MPDHHHPPFMLPRRNEHEPTHPDGRRVPDRPVVTLTVVERVGAATLAVFAGTLCTQTVLDLRGEILRLANSVGGDLEIDLSQVTFIDGRGLSMVVQLRQALAERHLDCCVGAASPIVRRLFELTGLDSLLSDLART